MSSKTFTPAWLERHRVSLRPVSRESIVGLDHVMEELASLLGRLSDVEAAAALGAPLPRGVLFHGEPGTGKTLVARYLATTLDRGVPLYELGADELSAARLRGTVRHLAAAHTRSVVFLDEIDQWGMHRDSGYHDPATRAVLIGALAALDGIEPADGVLVIAASNHGPDTLDPGLVRPGRLGIHIEFDLPDEAERAELLARLLARRPAEGVIGIARLAALTRGATPAAITAVVDDAAGISLARSGRAISDEDLLAAVRRSGRIDPNEDLSDAERRRIAVHEAGHAAVAAALRGSSWIHSVRLVAGGGRTELGPEGAHGHLVPDDELRDLAVVAMAGIAAERAVLGAPSRGGAVDVSTASTTAFERLTAGIDDRVPPLALDELRQYLPGSLKRTALDAIAGDLSAARERAAAIVARRIHEIERFADTLEATGELVGADLEAAIAGAGLDSGPAGDA